MMFRILAVALLAGACGTVAGSPAPDASVGDATGPGSDGSVPSAVMWEGQLAMSPTTTFGGNGFCTYSITLKQIDVQLAILPSGQVSSGQVQDLNMEAVVPTTPPCGGGPIPPNIATYQLATAVAGAGGMMLTFRGGSTNQPPADLVVTLTKVNTLYSAAMTFQRNDGQAAIFEWKVTTTIQLTPK
ncbi:MAG TPA: hypothetical protein VHW23_40005 [Kofleriaceae bacterium]|jgi:hypothetical protein|nr:hypothetical protein [Kofleriaceae bacterium]